MTRDEILAASAGRELDAPVAERVMGWAKGGSTDAEGRPVYRAPGRLILLHYWRPSTDIAAAWEVFEHYARMCWGAEQFNKRSRFFRELGGLLTHPQGQDLPNAVWPFALMFLTPLAICRAALLAELEGG